MNIVFFGTPQIATYILQELVEHQYNIVACYTQPDRPQGRGQKLAYSPVKALALKHKIKVLQPENLKSEAELIMLKQLKPDLLVVVAYGQILTAKFLQVPKFGGINVHTSLLPRWRGAAPIAQAILAGEPQTGVTIMQMDPGLDTGNILLQRSCNIEETDTTLTLTEKLAVLGGQALLDVLAQHEYFFQNSQPQDHTQATYAEKLHKNSSHINWELDADIIVRKIHAFNPWPGAYSLFMHDKINIWEARVVVHEYTFTPGTIFVDNDIILIAANTNFVQIITLQFAGKRILTAKEVLNSKRDLLSKGKLI